LRRRKAAPIPLDPDAHRQAKASGRRTTLTGKKGTTTEPFDGGTFTLRVLAHAGKGASGCIVLSSLRAPEKR
jgi:hypothetical protein